MNRKTPFGTACLAELAILCFAAIWNRFFQRPILADLHWSRADTLVGVVATVPPFVFFLWTLHSKLGFLDPHRHTLECALRPLFGKWSILQLTVISILAGVCEEAFFRGAIQGSLAERIGTVGALLLASALFGASHLITWTYAIITAFAGVYFGMLWIWTGNLLTPVITHAVYDIFALVYFLRIYRV